MSKENWIIPITDNMQTEGETDSIWQNLNRNIFSSLFTRECTQNTEDAGQNKKIPILRIRYNNKPTKEQKTLLEKLVTPLYDKYLEGLYHEKSPKLMKPSYLLVEDFNTTGLTGGYGDKDLSQFKKDIAEGVKDGNFSRGKKRNNYFSWRMSQGISIKSVKELGSRGAGKMVYHVASKYNVCFQITRRTDDKELLFDGTCRYNQVLSHNGHLLEKTGYYGEPSEDEKWCRPITDEKKIQSICKVFETSRNEDQYGTSFIIPFVSDNIIKENELAREVLSNFYLSINGNRLVLEYYSDEKKITVNEGNLKDELIKNGLKHEADNLAFIRAIESAKDKIITITLKDNTCDDNTITHNDFKSDKDIKLLKDKIREKSIVAIDIPVNIIRKSNKEKVKTKFTIYIKKHNSSDPKNREGESKSFKNLFRGDYHIRDGLDLAGIRNSKYLLCVRIAEDAISEFVRDAEDENHRKLQYNNSRIQKKWEKEGAHTTVNTIINCASAIIGIISDLSEQDSQSSASYLAMPGRSTKVETDPVDSPIEVDPPEPKDLILIPSVMNNKVTFIPNNDLTQDRLDQYFLNGVNFIVNCSVIDRDGQKFNELLDLKNKDNYSVTSSGDCKIFEINKSNFKVSCASTDFEFGLNYEPIDCLEVSCTYKIDRGK